MQSQFTDKAQNALAQAGRCARGLKQGYIGTEHILVGLLKEDTGVAAKVLADNGVEVDQVMEMIRDLIAFENGVAVKDKEGYSPRAARILEEAHRQAARFGQKQTGTEHLLLALIKEGENVAVRLLNTLGANVQKIYVDTLIAIGQDGNLYKEDLGKKGDRKAKQSTLEQYSRDLTALAREGKLDPVVGREEEIRRVVQILSRRTKNNPCLVGEPGVGKTAVVEGLAARIVAGDVPFTVQNKRVLTLDLSGMVAGSKYRGEFEERIKKVLKEVTEDGNIILFLDELHTIIGAGGAEGAIDASNIMKPSLARGEIQLIGATTIAEYRKYIEKDAALERRFQPVTVEEPTEEEAVRILEGIKGKYEDHHHVQITPEAIEAAVRLSSRYINDRNLPDKAIDLIDEASASARLSALDAPDKAKEIADRIHEMDQEMERAIRMEAFDQMAEIKKQQDALVKKYDRLMKKREKQEAGNVISIGENEIAEVVAQWTKIPVQKLAEKESERLLKLEKTLHKRVIGQEEAVTAVARAMRRGRVGLKDPNRPIGSFLFLGPTGVGKTELAKALAECLFDDERALVRIDMSEYMEKFSVQRLIGAPPGYVGYDEGGQLTEAVRRRPYSVILLDEVEKAHPDVFNILLQVLDDGRLTDGQGRLVSFRNAIIIMTSNIGSQAIREYESANAQKETMGDVMENVMKGDVETAAKSLAELSNKINDALRNTFRPEFLNRIDEVITFHALSIANMEPIVELQLNDVRQRLADRRVTLDVTPAAMDHLSIDGFDPVYGARPCKRLVQREIVDRIAQKIVEGKLPDRSHVLIDIDEATDEYVCRVEPPLELDAVPVD